MASVEDERTAATCTGKNACYGSYQQASEVARRMRQQDKTVQPYRCRRHGWHIGSVDPVARMKIVAGKQQLSSCHRWRGAQAEKKAQETQS